MSKKRTSPESSNDENETSDSVFQQQQTAKRANPASFSDTTLHDLPIELLGCILVKAVVMEVKGMKLAKSVWKEKAGQVITRLEEVCSQWSSILTSDFFRNELHRALDATAQETIRLEILHQSTVSLRPQSYLQSMVQLGQLDLATIKDEIFVLSTLSGEKDSIHVYDRNNMEKVKDVIPLPDILAAGLAACSLSNSVYTLSDKYPGNECNSFWRITRDEQRKFYISPWMKDLSRTFSSLSVSGNGSLITLSTQERTSNARHNELRIYNADASLQHEIVLSRNSPGDTIIQKSNGNLILVYYATYNRYTKLTEIDMTGSIKRQYLSPLAETCNVKCADVNERIVISSRRNRTLALLDSEFNPLNCTLSPPLVKDPFNITEESCFDSERNEIVGVSENGFLTICRFTEG